MRVISGSKKGHKLKAPKGMSVRPTEDRTKESLFNILGHIDEDSIVLDAFGGSGSIGIEFLSRGSKTCYFVDNSTESINTINENLNHTKFLEQSIVTKSDILAAMLKFSTKKLTFNYIYLDPPFRQIGLVEELLEVIDKEEILAKDGLIIVEHEKELDLEDNLFGFIKSDFRRYGSKSLSFYKRET
ncbi:16S rRNA (guanine(966)-N(2))-methyltransferase RsmD [Tissierella praeacuta]|uniref:16S rRNA (guanine(966)-N(2))-methyltransferase RsmD n=1 Tax=Tissierella praeacuta TaxID=43131 RepID=UPI0033417629